MKLTIADLKQYSVLESEIHKLSQDIEIIKAKAERSTKPTTIFSRGGISVDYNAELADLKLTLEIRKAKTLQLRNRMEIFINSVEDSLIRQILSLRYVNNLHWRDVAQHIGGNNTEDSVKQAAHRYFKK